MTRQPRPVALLVAHALVLAALGLIGGGIASLFTTDQPATWTADRIIGIGDADRTPAHAADLESDALLDPIAANLGVTTAGVRRGLRVQRITGLDRLVVEFTDTDRELAATVADLIATRHVARALQPDSGTGDGGGGGVGFGVPDGDFSLLEQRRLALQLDLDIAGVELALLEQDPATAQSIGSIVLRREIEDLTREVQSLDEQIERIGNDLDANQPALGPAELIGTGAIRQRSAGRSARSAVVVGVLVGVGIGAALASEADRRWGR